MNTVVKRRGKREGPTHRLWVTMAKTSFDALHEESEKLGLSIGALARQLIDRGVLAGLLYADTPSPQGADVVRVTQDERYRQLQDEQVRLLERIVQQGEEQIKLLHDRLDLKDQRIAQMQHGLEDYAETIMRQAKEIEWKETQARLTKRLES